MSFIRLSCSVLIQGNDTSHLQYFMSSIQGVTNVYLIVNLPVVTGVGTKLRVAKD